MRVGEIAEGVDKDADRDQALADPYYFAKHLLGYSLLIDELHGHWGKLITDEIDVVNLNAYRLLIQAFRGTYKSSFWTVSFPLWALARNPDLQILIVNEIYGNASDFLKEQQKHLLFNRTFRHLFGHWPMTNEFRDSDYTINRRTSLIGKESSLTAAGKNSALVSAHYDIIIIDDLVGRPDKNSAAQRKSTMNFYQDAFSLLKKNGIMIVVGTRWHREDLYHHIREIQNPELAKEGHRTFRTEFYPVKIGDRARFPTILDEQGIAQKRIEKGKTEFAAQYLLDPISDEEQTFRDFHFFDMKNVMTDSKPIYGYCDPSKGKRQERGDYSAIVTGVVDSDGAILIVDVDVDRRPVSTINSRILLKHTKFEYRTFGIEEDQYGVISEDLRRQSMSEGVYIPIRPQPASSKEKKVGRINAIEGLVSTGQVKFRSDWRTAPGNYRMLVEQLEDFPNAMYDDAADALEGLVTLIKRGSRIKFGMVGDLLEKEESK